MQNSILKLRNLLHNYPKNLHYSYIFQIKKLKFTNIAIYRPIKL